MIKKIIESMLAGLCGLLMVALFFLATSTPILVYSSDSVEFLNGYPQIQEGDIVGVFSSKGEELPRSQWQQVLASGRFDPVPSEEER